ncbi:hypothetical protein ACOMSG_12015 [Macellibacteroides fermentans]|uniref:hypothetical protein n=1 Tax=Macellibacteroides fermentans TaxID=879969 RepID=UPI003B9261F3
MKNRIIFLHSFLFAVTALNGTGNADPLKLRNVKTSFVFVSPTVWKNYDEK